MKRLVLASIMLGALTGPPALAAEPQTMGVFDAARESLVGDVYATPSSWRPLPARTFFSEGWNQPWASPAAGPGGAPRQGWINAFDGVFYRLGIVTAGLAPNVNAAASVQRRRMGQIIFARRKETDSCRSLP
jgi:hypothetical protein